MKRKKPRRLFRKPNSDRTKPVGPPGFIRGQHWDIYREATDWKVYMNPSLGVYHIKESLIDEFRRQARSAPELKSLDVMDLMGAIADLARGHLARLTGIIRAGSEIAASEGMVESPVRLTFYVVMQGDRTVFVTDDEPLYR